MQIRVCDRCLAQVPDAAPAAALRGVTLTPDLPSTNPVTGPIDVTLTVTVQAPADLCPPCRRSALTAYVKQDVKAAGTVKEVAALPADTVVPIL